MEGLETFMNKYSLSNGIERAFKEQNCHYDSLEHWLKRNFNEKTAFSCAFTWKKTREGHDYWALVEKLWGEEILKNEKVSDKLERIVNELRTLGV